MESPSKYRGLQLIILAAFFTWLGGVFAAYSNPDFVRQYYEAISAIFTTIGLCLSLSFAARFFFMNCVKRD